MGFQELVRPPSLPFRRVEVSGEHLDPPGLEVDAGHLDVQVELFEERAATRNERSRVVERALHRVEAPEQGEQVPLGLAVARGHLD